MIPSIIERIYIFSYFFTIPKKSSLIMINCSTLIIARITTTWNSIKSIITYIRTSFTCISTIMPSCTTTWVITIICYCMSTSTWSCSCTFIYCTTCSFSKLIYTIPSIRSIWLFLFSGVQIVHLFSSFEHVASSTPSTQAQTLELHFFQAPQLQVTVLLTHHFLHT